MENKPYIKVKKNNETVGMIQTPTASGTIVGIKEENGSPKYTTDGTTYKEFSGGSTGVAKHVIWSGNSSSGILSENLKDNQVYYFTTYWGGYALIAYYGFSGIRFPDQIRLIETSTTHNEPYIEIDHLTFKKTYENGEYHFKTTMFSVDFNHNFFEENAVKNARICEIYYYE